MSSTCLPVLMYHHVSPHVGSLTVSPGNFAAQLDWLARAGYTTLGAAGLADFFAGRPMPRKPVVLTFDDGYLDNYVYAHPELASRGMTAMLFTITGWMGEGEPRPHAGQGLALPETFGHREAKALAEADRHDAVMARWSELQAMQQAGSFEIHSHTHTHTRWDQRVADPVARREALAADLAASREALELRLGVVSDQLCWPQGYFDDDYLQVAEAAGFRHFHTTNARELNRPGQDIRRIYRVAVKNRRGLAFAQRVWLAGHPFWGALYNRWKR